MRTVAFVGLGNMGSPMAVSLLKAGFKVQVFDKNEHALQLVKEQGAVVAKTLTDVVVGADCIITMLPEGRHVRDVYLGNGEGHQGVIELVAPTTLLIDCSTIDPATARHIAQQAKANHLYFVDSPVSGGVAGAQAATLTFIVGGEDHAFKLANPILGAMGKNIFHAGESGCGQMGKICNNLLLGVLMAGTCEALNLGIENGLDPKVLSNIIMQSSGRNWALELYNPCPGVMDNVPSSNGYQGGFMSKLMLKDLGLGLEAATHSQSSIPMGSLARNLYAFHNQNGNQELDFSSLFEFYRNV